MGEGAVVDAAVIGPRAQIGAGCARRSGRRRGAGRVDSRPVRRSPRGSASSRKEPDEPVRGDVRTGRAARGAAARRATPPGRPRWGPRVRTPRRPSRSARSAAPRSAAASPRRCGATRCARPTVVNRAAALPGWVGPGHLVVAVSYSGATAETLTAAKAALARGADVIAVTAGDPLGEVVERRRGTGRARRGRPAAAGRARLAVRGAGRRARARRRHAAGRRRHPRRRARLRRRRRATAAAASRASSARPSRRRPPGSTATARSRPSRAASRASSTRTRSPRPPSASSPRPTTTRSSAGPAPPRTGGRHAAIHLADPDDPPTIRASIATTPRLIDDDATLHRVLTGQGQTRTARAFWLLSLLDHASVHTARAAGVDPFEIDRIAELKQALAAAK